MMKLYRYTYFLIIFFLFKNTYEEKSFLEKLIDEITGVKKLNGTEIEEDEESELIIEENIYEMNSTNEFDLNIKINGTDNNSLIILFYSKSCGHCKKFIPIYREISEILKNDTSIKFSKIKYSLCEEIFKKYPELNVLGVPTIYMYKRGHFIRHEGSRNKENVMSFIFKIKNYKCHEISSLEQLSLYINQDIIFSKDKEKNFVLGIFNKDKELDKEFILHNFLEINHANNDIVLNNKCFYFFKNEKINLDLKKSNNFYLKYALLDKNGQFGDYLIYSYNYQKGLNTFNLFNSYLNIKNNFSKIDEFDKSNTYIDKNLKIIKNKYKIFLEENYLYKYYYINNSDDVYNFTYYGKKLFIFYYEKLELEKFYIDEINYILSLNSSLNCDYLFILFNTTNDIFNRRKRLSFFNMEFYDDTVLLNQNDLNKTSLESKILEYIYKDRKHLLKMKLPYIQQTILNIYDWFSGFFVKNNNTNTSQNNLIELNNDFEQELIDEINKTIIEDEKLQKLEQEKRKNQSINLDKKNLKNLKNIQKRRKILNTIQNIDFGFNKNLILFPVFLIIYSLLFFLCYKYVFGKFENKIFYKRLPTEDPKNK